ncbi:MAG: penicillin acylase family protein [Deltaproteobacteria bacterium]|nr:penicillin acylase family protein [Deltaproteobacteria bacterium]
MRSLFFLILFAAVFAGCSNHLASKQSPVEEKVFMQRGLFGEPSIRVESASDPDWALFEQQGYVEAVDRFFQMDILRRSARGTLAELLGEKVVSEDQARWNVGLPQAILKSEEKLRQHFPDEYRVLEAFSTGVNRFIAKIAELDRSLLYRYQKVTNDVNYLPSVWTPGDSIAIGSALAFLLSNQLEEKAILGMLNDVLWKLEESKTVSDFLDLRPFENEFILQPALPASVSIQPQENRGSDHQKSPYHFRCRELGFPFHGCRGKYGIGSNNWVVSRPYTDQNAVIVANDPHLPLTFPTVLYEIALDSKSAGGRYRVRGVNLPGAPGVLIGHNDNIAWALTNSMADIDDLYVENFDVTGSSVFFRNQKVVVRKDKHLLKVRAGSNVFEKEIVVRWVPHHGPIVSDFFLKQTIPNVGISYRWNGHEGTTEVAALLGVNRAGDYPTFKAALQFFEAGPQNVLYGDRQGNIGYYSHGLFPMRQNISLDVPPFIPQPGQASTSAADHEWTGYRTNIPELYNPASGRIVSANNDPYGMTAYKHDYRDYFGFEFSSTRARRIVELLDSKKGKLNVDEMRSIQFDHRDGLAVRFVAMLREALPLKLSEKGLVLAQALVRWNLEAGRNQVEPVYFYTWVYALNAEWFKDLIGNPEYPELFKDFVETSAAIHTLYNKLHELLKASPQTAKEIMARALDKAAVQLTDKNMWDQRWGQLHRLAFLNPFKGLLPHEEWVPLERDGSWDTVDSAGFTGAQPDGSLPEDLPSSWGPGCRLIMVLKENEPIVAFNVLPGDSFTELFRWRDGKHRPLVRFIAP